MQRKKNPFTATGNPQPTHRLVGNQSLGPNPEVPRLGIQILGKNIDGCKKTSQQKSDTQKIVGFFCWGLRVENTPPGFFEKDSEIEIDMGAGTRPSLYKNE